MKQKRPKPFSGPFVMCPSHLLSWPSIHRGARLGTFLLLARLEARRMGSDDPVAWPSIRFIKETLDVSMGAVQEAIKWLVAEGLVEKTTGGVRGRGHRPPNVYRINWALISSRNVPRSDEQERPCELPRQDSASMGVDIAPCPVESAGEVDQADEGCPEDVTCGRTGCAGESQGREENGADGISAQTMSAEVRPDTDPGFDAPEGNPLARFERILLGDAGPEASKAPYITNLQRHIDLEWQHLLKLEAPADAMDTAETIYEESGKDIRVARWMVTAALMEQRERRPERTLKASFFLTLAREQKTKPQHLHDRSKRMTKEMGSLPNYGIVGELEEHWGNERRYAWTAISRGSDGFRLAIEHLADRLGVDLESAAQNLCNMVIRDFGRRLRKAVENVRSGASMPWACLDAFATIHKYLTEIMSDLPKEAQTLREALDRAGILDWEACRSQLIEICPDLGQPFLIGQTVSNCKVDSPPMDPLS